MATLVSWLLPVAGVAALAAYLWASVTASRRWDDAAGGAHDLRRADDGDRFSRGDGMDGWRGTEIPVQKWPPDAPSRQD